VLRFFSVAARRLPIGASPLFGLGAVGVVLVNRGAAKPIKA
jgi:hypothetical protein